MFTGLIEEVGTLLQVERVHDGARLVIAAKQVLGDARIGDSIAVSGVCLTVTGLYNGSFAVDMVAETLARSTLSRARPGDRMNLERAMSVQDRFGGHIVAGHVDGTGVITGVQNTGMGTIYTITTKPDLTRYIVDKGSITVDGVSLTVMTCEADRFQVSLIPHSANATTLGTARKGQAVNLEVDVLAKYVEKLLTPQVPGEERGLTALRLRDLGY
ncbi:MAG: riboflavin synthase [Firmicutes bacterium]|nr:riboflavin synthase [Bacillota bacterium]